MRPLLLLTLATLLPAAPAAAQLRLGTRVGWNQSDTWSEDEPEFVEDTRTGLLAGVFLEGGLRGRFGYQVGAQYSQKGIHGEFADGVRITFAMDYVEMPVVLTMALPQRGIFLLQLMGGFAPALKVACEGRASGGTRHVEETCGVDDPDLELEVAPVKDFDLGGIFGGGLGFEVGSAQLFGEAFYTWGLIPYGENVDPEFDTDTKHRVLSLTLGANIGL